MSAIHSDAAILNDYPDAIEDDDAFMNALFDNETDEVKDAPKEPSSEDEEEKEDETTTDDEANDDDEASDENPEEEDGESEDDGEAKEDEAKAKKFVEVDDDTYVKIKVDGEDREVKVADLNRLWGQEAALTRKSQEVATAKTQYDEGTAKNLAAYSVLMNRATERAEEFRKLPWTQLMRDQNVPNDQLVALQEDARKAFEEEAFLKNSIDGFMQKVQTDQLAARKVAAAECLQKLNDTASPLHIKGWSEALYNDLRTFASGVGIAPEMVNSITDPAVIKILHMAHQFQKGASKVVTTKVKKTPTKIVKSTASAPASRTSAAKTVVTKQAVAKAARSGSEVDAIAAFEALFD
jgi:hypothetical protein